jgi:hypothetical protein
LRAVNSYRFLDRPLPQFGVILQFGLSADLDIAPIFSGFPDVVQDRVAAATVSL